MTLMFCLNIKAQFIKIIKTYYTHIQGFRCKYHDKVLFPYHSGEVEHCMMGTMKYQQQVYSY